MNSVLRISPGWTAKILGGFFIVLPSRVIEDREVR
jgi:hypothetical protein